jgi:hypothetical protein
VTAPGEPLPTPPPSIITVIPDGNGGSLATTVFTDKLMRKSLDAKETS